MNFSLRPLILFSLLGSLFAAGPLRAQTPTGNTISGTISSGGQTRQYLVYVPTAYRQGTPVPLVVNSHGQGDAISAYVNRSNFRQVADTAHFLLVYPQALLDPAFKDKNGNPSTAWNAFGSDDRVDDAGFIADLITKIESQYTIDAQRVYAVGHSNGGFMTFLLAAQLSTRLAAVAPISGGIGNDQIMTNNPVRPVPVFAIHGENDNVVTYSASLVKQWAQINGCASTPTIDKLFYTSTKNSDKTEVDRSRWSTNMGTYPVISEEVLGAVHNLDSFLNFGKDNSSDGDNMAGEIWRFLRKYRLPTPTSPDPSANLALNKPVCSSGLENSWLASSAAVDGQAATRWASPATDPQWLVVDLGASYSINRVKLSWQAAYGEDYTIDVSNDASTWTPMRKVTGNTNLTPDYTGLVGVGRYVRLNGTVRGTQYGYSLWELEVYGNPVTLPLPVTLVNFTAEPVKANTVYLAWTTASELNSATFEIERSLDGRTFTPLGHLPAAGTSTTSHPYYYLDSALPASTAYLYYRLRQVDMDGSATYSPVQTVYLAGAGGLCIFPNPAHQAATLLGAASGAPVQVFDMMGRLVLSLRADATGRATLGLPAGRPPGAYVVRSGQQTTRFMTE